MDVDVLLAALEALRSEGHLCLQTCVMIFEPLFQRGLGILFEVGSKGEHESDRE